MEGNIKDVNYNNNEVVLLREFYKQYKHTAQAYIDFAKNKVYTDNQLKVISKPTHHYAVFGIVLILIGIITFTFLIGVVFLIFGILLIAIPDDTARNIRIKEQTAVKESNIKANYIINYLKQQYFQTNRIVAFNYASPFIVEKLLWYIDSHRADSVKEAINLYESERTLFLQQQIQNINSSHKMYEFTNDYLAFDTFMGNIGIFL